MTETETVKPQCFLGSSKIQRIPHPMKSLLLEMLGALILFAAAAAAMLLIGIRAAS